MSALTNKQISLLTNFYKRDSVVRDIVSLHEKLNHERTVPFIIENFFSPEVVHQTQSVFENRTLPLTDEEFFAGLHLPVDTINLDDIEEFILSNTLKTEKNLSGEAKRRQRELIETYFNNLTTNRLISKATQDLKGLLTRKDITKLVVDKQIDLSLLPVSHPRLEEILEVIKSKPYYKKTSVFSITTFNK